jgi:hypothetical protein
MCPDFTLDHKPGFSRVYFPSAPSPIVSKNRARYTTNPNNKYFEIFKGIIQERQGDGYYSGAYHQEYCNISAAEKTKMEVAAQAICNYHLFEGVEYKTETYIDDDDEWFNIYFDWSGGISHGSSSDEDDDDEDDDDSDGGLPNCPDCNDSNDVKGPDSDGDYWCTYSECNSENYFS